MAKEEIQEKYSRLTPKSNAFYMEALKLTPGGVMTNGRFRRPYPVFIKRAAGSRIYDVDGREYVDYLMGYGPIILGHSHPKVNAAIINQLQDGLHFGACNELEVSMAKKIVQHVPTVEMVRITNSGTEANLYAFRTARAFTGRRKIAKFEGAFHGGHDQGVLSTLPSLSEAGPPYRPHTVPFSMGLIQGALDNVVILPWNDLSACEHIIREEKDDLAAVALEPLAGFMGLAQPLPGFLEGLREITEKHFILLIWDEVVTGFRIGLSGAQGYYGIKPDLTVLGKVIGGGLPIGAFGGRRDIMETIDPARSERQYERVFHAGTFNGYPLALAAGLAVIDELEKPGVYHRLNSITARLRKGLQEAAERLEIDVRVAGLGSVMKMYFSDHDILDYRDWATSDLRKTAQFDLEMLNRAFFCMPGHSWMTSLAHTEEDVDRTIDNAEEALRTLS